MKLPIDSTLLLETIALLISYGVDEFAKGADILSQLKEVLNEQPINGTTSIDEGESSNTCST